MTTDIKRRKDGSIDTSHYIARGRQVRSEAFHIALRHAPPPRRAAPRLPILVIGVLLAATPLLF